MRSIRHSSLAGGVWVGLRACLLAIAAGLLLASPAAIAQSIFGNLSGTVTDSSGALVPGAKVLLQNDDTKATRQFVTNNAGYFSATELPTGSYTVTAQLRGFQTWKGTGIVLNSADNKAISISLKIGAESQTVQVNAASSDIAVIDSGDRVSRISSEQLDSLSLVGRNSTEYLKILPGAAQVSNGGTNRPSYTGEVVGINDFSVGGGAGGMTGVSINGQVATGLSISQDGQNTEDPGAPGQATPVNPNPDMISQVTVMSSNFGAENQKGPIVIDSTTKSGTDSFHGDVHFYARNSAMNTEDSFNKAIESDPTSGFTKGQLKIPSHYYYPGGSIGGPVLIPGTSFNKAKKKYFFFEAFESYRQLIDGGVDRSFVPTSDMMNGDWSALGTWTNLPGRFGMSSVPTEPSGGISSRPGCTINGGVMTQACISSMAKQYMLNALPGTTTVGGEPDGNGFNYIAPVQESQNSNQNMLRVDANFTDSTKVYVTWSRQRETANMPLGLWNNPGDWIIPAPSATLGNNSSDLYTVNFVHVFSPTLTVEARAGYTHVNFPSSPKSPSKVFRSDLNFPQKGVFGNPNMPVALSWSQSIPTLGDIGHDYHPTMMAVKGIPSTGADVTKVINTHTIKGGFFWESAYNKQDNWGQYMGVYTYSPWSSQVSGNNYADMLMGVGFSGYFEQALPPAIKMVGNQLSFYARDHWKITRRITIDYGLRFEHYPSAYADNQWGVAVFDKQKYQGGVTNSGISWHGLDSSIPKSGNTGNPVLFSPRFGASIDVYGTGKTILRGGWGQYRFSPYVVNPQNAAATAEGSTTWGCGGSSDCETWESIDSHINNGQGGCAAGVNCAPAIAYGQVTTLNNTSFSVIDPHNHDQPVTTSYSINVDQQIPAQFVFEISYVGNHSDKAQNGLNINSVPVGALNNQSEVNRRCPSNPNPNNATCQQQFRPYSSYQAINATQTSGKSQYDSLQVSLNRTAGWARISLNYTWAKNLGNTTTAGAFRDYGVSEYWSVLPVDRAQVFNAAYVFDLPRMRDGNQFVRGALNGWQFSGITQLQSGAQLTANTGANLGLANAASGVTLVGSPDVSAAPSITCNPRVGLGSHQFANPNCFALPAAGGIGNGRFPYIAGPAYWNSDATIRKIFNITERQSLEVRFAAFNFMNHDLRSFSPSDNNLKLSFDSSGQLTNATDTKHACPGPQCAAFGYADYFYGHRILEVGAKYTF